jgi:predicted peptidase
MGVLLLACGLAPAVAAQSPPAPGDANLNGYASLEDVALTLRFIVGLDTPSDSQRAAVDVVKDGVIDLKDAQRILKNALGLRIADRFLRKTITLSGVATKYAVYVPPSYDPAVPWPTIVFLNGAGECGRDGLLQTTVGLGPAIKLKPASWPFIVVMPQKPTSATNWEDHDALVMATLEQTRREYNVDVSRLYLTGLSQGGHGTWTIAAKHPDLFAAIAPCCGWGSDALVPALKGIPAWVFHGEADTTISVNESRKMVAALLAAGAPEVKLTTYKGIGHNCWDNAYQKETLYAWFLAHQKTQ